MNIIDECSLWLQTYIDGENSAVFSAITKDIANTVNQMEIQDQKLWLVDFWFSQMHAVNIPVQGKLILDHSRATIINQGTEAFMCLIKAHIEQYNLPRC